MEYAEQCKETSVFPGNQNHKPEQRLPAWFPQRPLPCKPGDPVHQGLGVGHDLHSHPKPYSGGKKEKTLLKKE